MSIYQTGGLMCALPGNVPVDFATIKKLGYSYVSPQGCNGARQVGRPEDLKPGERRLDQYAAGLRADGLKCVPWAKLYGGTADQVKAEAEASAQMIAWAKPDGWMINPETEFKEDGAWRSSVYVTALKGALARLKVPLDSLQWAVQPLGGAALDASHPEWDVSPWTFSYDVEPWLSLPGVWCLPEAYWTPTTKVDGASKDYRPLNCADAWIGKLEWPAERFAFTLGWWNGDFPTPEEYFADLAIVRQRFPKWGQGFCLYLADQATADIIKRFAAGVAKGYAATAEGPAPTPAPAVNPLECRAAIEKEALRWLDARPGPERLSRLRTIQRIANTSNVDAKWANVNVGITDLLDQAGL